MTPRDKAKELQREYLREWRRKNPERVKQYRRTYWERKANAEAERRKDEINEH